LVLFALAAMNQAEARPEAPETAVPIREVIEERVSIFPFVALVVGSALLLHAELWDRSALVILIAAIGLVTLIAVRQFVTQAEMIRLEHALQAARDRLADLANQDTLTALPNRRAVETTLGEEIERAHRYEHRFSVLFLDIDHFKAINDALGHAVGDQVLSEFAAIVKVCLRPIDTLGRWGGEEFLAVLPETDAGEAVIAAERIRRRIDKHDFGLEGDMGPTCSIGVSSYPDDGLAVDALVHTADFAMYEAKRQGRNQVASAHHPAPTPA
jgi:diguanylate cyclase (GGDEF)-like protein